MIYIYNILYIYIYTHIYFYITTTLCRYTYPSENDIVCCVHGYKPPCAVCCCEGGGDPKDASEMLNDPEMMKAMAMAGGAETQNQVIGPPKLHI